MKIPSLSAGTWVKLGLVAVLAIALVVTWQFLPIRGWMQAFIDYADRAGWQAYAVFLVVYVLGGSLGFPRTLLNVAGGIVFDLWIGLAVVLVSAIVTFTVTFNTARHFARDWVNDRIDKVPNAKKVLDAVEHEGFKMVALMRVNPFVPGVLKGYGFGTTDIPYWKYLLGSIVGFIPIGTAHVYLGWIGGEAMIAEEGLPEEFSTTVLVGGVVLSVILVVTLLWISHRALNRRTVSAS